MISINTKKLAFLLISGLAPFSSSYANTSFDGVYFGLGLGQSITTSTLDATRSASLIVPRLPFDIFINNSYTQNFKKNVGMVSLYTGYGFACDPLYLGGELFFKISNGNSFLNDTSNGGSRFGGTFFKVSDYSNMTFRKTEFAIDVRPGILLSECSLLYGRIGITRNKITLNSNLVASFGTPILATGSIPLNQSKIKKSNALRLGVGMEQMITACMSVRLDYIYTRYRRIGLSAAQSATITPITGTPVTTSVSDSFTVKPSNSSFILGLTYYW